MKKTLIIGVSTNPEKYAFKAANRLIGAGHEVVLVGQTTGQVAGNNILTQMPLAIDNLDTITLYVAPKHQAQYQEAILQLQPKRVIFNPGTENPALEGLLVQHNIQTLEACTLVMLGVGTY